ncbi:MAG: DNA methylase, partial [Pseudomonadota bacterium]|nr:DNA methylase [Pseudomonadota bacterium]
RLRIEHNAKGDRAKAFLYCLETRCPDTDWMIPMSTTWIVSRVRPTVAELVPDPEHKRFDIRIRAARDAEDLVRAATGTVRDGDLVYEIDGKSYRRSVSSIRGDYRDAKGETRNKLRPWERREFLPRPEDTFQERLYCIQWMTASTLHKRRPATFFASVTNDDLERERLVESIVAENLYQWQSEGLVPDMAIEPGDETTRLIRERGWMYWHHLFNSRQLYCAATLAIAAREIDDPLLEACLAFDRTFLADKSAKLSQWRLGSPGRAGRAPSADGAEHVFYNQALNPFFNYATRGFWMLRPGQNAKYKHFPVTGRGEIATGEARSVNVTCDAWVTDPPYADAVVYHEITEYFIAWLRLNPPAPYAQWKWDSRRDLAITGSGDDFRRGMVDAYKGMTKHMPDNGMQCVMFTHQDTGVWSDMVSIFWAAGLQVVGAWYIATETTSELKKGGYVQGTVILMLRKRPAGDRPGFKQRILPQVKREVDAQIKQMLHLNTETEAKMGAPVFNDSDLQMAGYAAALKVLTGFTTIGGEDVTTFALRPRRKGETTVVDEIVQQSAETANSLLVPVGLDNETWHAIAGIQRFYLRMLDMETTGASKLDNYQNFAKAFRVQDYAAVMANIRPNAARLKSVTELKPRDLTDRTEFGPTPLGALIVAIQEFLAEKEPEVVLANLRDAVVDYLHLRPVLIDMTDFIAAKARAAEVRRTAEAIASRMRNQRLQ